MKKYIITITLFCLSLILIDDAYALTGDYASSNFQIFTYDSPEGGTRTSSGYSSGLNVSQYLNGGYLDGLYIQVFGNDDIVYEAGNTYTFVFKVNFNPKNWKYLDNTFTTSNLKVSGSKTSSPTNMSTENITASSLSIANVDGDTYQMIYTFKVVPEVNLKYLLFQCFYPYGLLGADLNYVYNLLTVRVVDLSVTYEQGVGAIVDQQTTVIQNSTNQILNSQQQTNDKLDETNKELGEVKDEIKNQFENCRDSYNLFFTQMEVGAYDYINGVKSNNSQYIRTRDLINVEPSKSYSLSFTGKTPLTNSGFIFFKDGVYVGRLVTTNLTFTVPSNANQVAYNLFIGSGASVDDISNIMLNIGSSPKPYEKYGEKVCSNRIDETNDKLDNLNDSLTNDSTSGATDSAGSFFEGFTTDTFGLTSIITSPLNLIKSITSKTCTPLNLQIPFVNKNMQLPCMTTIYTNYFGSFLTIYQTITFGIISYWVCIRIFALVKDFKNPDHDEIEVMDL